MDDLIGTPPTVVTDEWIVVAHDRPLRGALAIWTLSNAPDCDLVMDCHSRPLEHGAICPTCDGAGCDDCVRGVLATSDELITAHVTESGWRMDRRCYRQTADGVVWSEREPLPRPIAGSLLEDLDQAIRVRVASRKAGTLHDQADVATILMADGYQVIRR